VFIYVVGKQSIVYNASSNTSGDVEVFYDYVTYVIVGQADTHTADENTLSTPYKARVIFQMNR
jgi:hypothetical protein